MKNELRRTGWAKENEKQQELQNLLWAQELEKHLADKTFPSDQLQQQDQLGMQNDWSVQLQQNLLENEKNKKKKKKKLETKSEFHQSFQNMISKKLVALLLEKHFASAASSSFLATKHGRSIEKLQKRSASRRQLEAKNFLTSFEENNLTAKTFGQTILGHFAPATSKTAASKKRPSKKRPSQRTTSQKAA